MKKYFFISAILLACISDSLGQAMYIVPREAGINEEVTLYINAAHPDCNCPNIRGSNDDMFFWTWQPSDPVVGNGQWNKSNEKLKLTREGPDLYSIKFKPAEFYTINDVARFYDENIKGLIKKSDGGSGGSTDLENKSADLTAEIDPAPGCRAKFCPFPRVNQQDDYFTIIYDNVQEENTGMQNLQPGNAFLFARCVADGTLYEVSKFEDVGNNPDLEMLYEGNGKFTLTFVPQDFFPIPQGAVITTMLFVVRKKVFASPGDKTDGVAVISVGCQ